MLQNAGFLHDASHVPITQLGLTTTDSQTLVGSGATVDVPIFGITGSVLVNSLYGVITTALGNNTAAYWRLNDQTAQVSITLSTGTTLTSKTVGSTIVKKALAATALTLIDAAAGAISEPAAAEGNYFSPFIVQQKTGAITTNIEFVYTTSDTPTTGAITFYLGWVPLSVGATVAAL